MKPIKYFSMFSGIGGFEYGLQQSKHEFKNVGYSEIDKYARSIYEKNYTNHICFGDATKINTEDLPDFSFLIGGFPCQTFSIAGKRAGFNDTRGTMFFELARILRDKQPSYFLFENVKGILSHEGGRTLNRILKILNELGYDVLWENYNSRDYNVPQNRERIYFKGYFRERERCSFEVLLKRRSNAKSNVRLIPLNKKKQAQQVFSTDGLSMTLCVNGGGQGGKTGLYKVDVSENENSTLVSDDWSKHFTKVNATQNVTTTRNGDCFAILTRQRDNSLAQKRDNYVLNNETFKIRRLTPIECERLQGFPDNYTKYGKDGEIISDTQRYKCLGNAVTTTVVTAIADEMFEGVTQ